MEKLENIYTKIVTPEKVFFEEHINFITIKIAKGFASFSLNHSPEISTIQPSIVVMNYGDNKIRKAAIMDGVISIFPSSIEIISNEIFWAKDINEDKTKQKLLELNKKMENKNSLLDIEYNILKKSIEEQNIKLRLLKEEK